MCNTNHEFVCPHNDGVDCKLHYCDNCGWNPAVAEARLTEIIAKMPVEKKFTIPFTGYCEVFAKDPEEALAKAEDTQHQFFAYYDYGKPVCSEKEDEDEVD